MSLLDDIGAIQGLAKPQDGDFVRGLKQSGHELLGTGYGMLGLAGAGTGIDALKAWGLEKAKERFDASEALGKPTDQLEGIGSVGDAADYLQRGLGYVAGQAIPSIVTGGVGSLIGKKLVAEGVKNAARQTAYGLMETGVAPQVAEGIGARIAAEQVAKAQTRGALAGAGLTSYVQEAGSMYPEMVKEGHDEPGRAALFAAPAAALDVIPELGLWGKVFKPKGVGLPGQVQDGFWKTVGKEAGKQAGMEAGTEAAQTAIERAAAYKALTGKEAMSDYLNSAALGALGGGVIGGATAPFNMIPTANQPPPSPADTPPAAEQKPLGLLPHYPEEPMVVFPDGTTMTAAEARQQRADGFTYSAPAGTAETAVSEPVAPAAPVGEKTPFFEPPIVDGTQYPDRALIRPQPAIALPGNAEGTQVLNPNPQLELPGGLTPLQVWQGVYEKQQRGELLTQQEIFVLNNPPNGIPTPQAAAAGPAVRQPQPTQGEMFPTPLPSAYEAATRGMDPVTRAPVLDNQQNPTQGELFFPNGQPTYAATQGQAPDLANAATETAKVAGIGMGKPSTKMGARRKELLDRIEKARVQGRFVGREEAYDNALNLLSQNAFGMVEQGLDTIEKTPLMPVPTGRSDSPLAEPATRTIYDVVKEMSALETDGKPPRSGRKRVAWGKLKNERDRMAEELRVAPPAVQKQEQAQETKEPPKQEPSKQGGKQKAQDSKEPPKREQTQNQQTTTPNKETPPEATETPAEAFNAMEDRVQYKDLSPEAKSLVNEYHKAGQLSQDAIDFIVKQDKDAKVAAKRKGKKADEDTNEPDLYRTKSEPREPTVDDVPPVVMAQTKVKVTAYDPDSQSFVETEVNADEALASLREDLDTFKNFVKCLKKG